MPMFLPKDLSCMYGNLIKVNKPSTPTELSFQMFTVKLPYVCSYRRDNQKQIDDPSRLYESEIAPLKNCC